ncbi:MAG TPA: TadE family protein [Rhizomicrobium sp.]|nr:TadE family protein [Rhizomicrobium sp.]
MRMRWKRFDRGFLKADSGIAAIEFAVFGAVLCFLAIATADVGMGFYSYMQVQNAAQAGAEYAAVHGWNSAAITNAVTNATSVSGLSASPAPTQFYGCVVGTSVNSVAQGTVCTNGMSAGTYVTASAQRTYTTLISYPGFASSYDQTSTSTVRIQ